MNRFIAHVRSYAWFVLGGLTLVACAPAHFTTLTIYETPQSFVQLEVDRTLEHDAGHTHPSDISPDQMAAVLRGITIVEPLIRLPFYDDVAVPRRHPVFSDHAIEFWAPLLSLALKKASPQEVVTFYQSLDLSGTKREVTSGGLYVDGDELHLILSNLKSGTHYAADIGVADVADDRLTPMRSLAPQHGKLGFDPESALREPDQSFLTQVFHDDRRELVVLYKTLPLKPSKLDD